MDRLLIKFFLLLVILTGQVFAQDFVLVTSSEVEYEDFSKLELRKVFLGYRLSKNDRPVLAIINRGQADNYNRFLQMVVSTSELRYEKQLLAQSFRQGTLRPEFIDDIESLKKELLERPGAISFMWSDDIVDTRGLEVIQVLWSSSD